MRPESTWSDRAFARLLQQARRPWRILLLAAVAGGLFAFGIRFAFGLTLTVTGLIITRFAQNGLSVNASSCVVTANYIGTDGTSALANGQYGIYIQGSSNTIGSTSSFNRNLISGNTGDGIYVASGANNVIKGNWIGLNASGTALGNGGDGVNIDAATSTTIGGTAANTGNVIAYNALGVYVGQNSAVSNAIEGNSIYGNTGLGIDVVNFTTNTGSKNSGLANYSMNYGVFTSASLRGSTLTGPGYVRSAANQRTFTTSRVEIFKSDNDASGRGEGNTYIGFLTADSQGNFSGPVTLPSTVTLFSGDKITATATDTLNNTSEFGTNFAITGTFYNLSGTVFEDMNYAGGAGRTMADASGVGVNGTPVEEFNSGGTLLNAASTSLGGAPTLAPHSAGTSLDCRSCRARASSPTRP